MLDQQAIEQLTNEIANAFNANLPEPTTDEMADAMADIATKNTQTAGILANAIRRFMLKSRVTMPFLWNSLKILLRHKLSVQVFITKADIDYCIANPEGRRRLQNGTSLIIANQGGEMSFLIVEDHAIS